MKILLASILLLVASCTQDVNPTVETIRVSGDYNVDRDSAISNLYNYYTASSKSKEYYEVIKKGDFILNFYPKGKLLTICHDQGSGWASQFRDFDESDFKKLADDKITFDQIAGFLTLDNALDSSYNAILIKNRPIIEVKTNGTPR